MLEVRLDARSASARIAALPRNVRKQLERELRRAGSELQRAMRAEFGGRLSDEHRRRPDRGGRKLGTWSGRGRESIGVRTRFKAGGSRPLYKVFIGPPGGLGVAAEGFHIAFHEFGVHKYPRRPVAAPARRKHFKRITKAVARIVERAVAREFNR